MRRIAIMVGLAIWNLPRNLLIGFIRLWRLLISPLYGPTCKYYPSCSAYGLEAVRRHGAVRGSALTLWRIVRCNPWSDGGIDDVPPPRRKPASNGPTRPSPGPHPAGTPTPRSRSGAPSDRQGVPWA